MVPGFPAASAETMSLSASTDSIAVDKRRRHHRLVKLINALLLVFGLAIVSFLLVIAASALPYLASSGSLFVLVGELGVGARPDRVGGIEVVVPVHRGLAEKCSFILGAIASTESSSYQLLSLKESLSHHCTHSEESWKHLWNSTLATKWTPSKRVNVTLSDQIPDRINLAFNESIELIERGRVFRAGVTFLEAVTTVNHTLHANLTVEGLFPAEQVTELWRSVVYFISDSDADMMPRESQFLLTAPIKYDGSEAAATLHLPLMDVARVELYNRSHESGGGGCFGGNNLLARDDKGRCFGVEEEFVNEHCLVLRGNVTTSVACPALVLPAGKSKYVPCRRKKVVDIAGRIKYLNPNRKKKQSKNGTASTIGSTFRFWCGRND